MAPAADEPVLQRAVHAQVQRHASPVLFVARRAGKIAEEAGSKPTRRQFLRTASVLAAGSGLSLVGHADDVPNADLVTADAQAAIDRGLAYLAGSQAGDGSFSDSRSSSVRGSDRRTVGRQSPPKRSSRRRTSSSRPSTRRSTSRRRRPIVPRSPPRSSGRRPTPRTISRPSTSSSTRLATWPPKGALTRII